MSGDYSNILQYPHVLEVSGRYPHTRRGEI